MLFRRRSYLMLGSMFFLCGDAVGPSMFTDADNNAPMTVTVTPDTLQLEVGDAGAATCTPRNRIDQSGGGGAILTNPCKWTSRNPTVATVPSTLTQNASITAKNSGATWVLAELKGKRDSVHIIVSGAFVTAVNVTPTSATLAASATQQFSAMTQWTDSLQPFQGIWSATGGTVTQSGLYTAGQTGGSYRVIAAEAGKADTAPITITSVASVVSVSLTPATATIDTGQTQQFTATTTWTDSVRPFAGTYTATGGGITQAGLYTAGGVAGTAFRAIATQAGKADTSAITVRAAATAGCPTSGYLRLVNVSTVSQLTAAVANALAGDQIRLAAGNYALGSDLIITRSGTSSNRITICGPRTAVVSARPIKPNSTYLTLRGFRITGGLWGIYSEGGSRNVYDSLEVDHTGQEAVHIRMSAKHNEIKYLYIHDTGMGNPTFAEGIYLGNGATGNERTDSNHVHHNTLLNIKQECMESKAGTTGNLIEYNTMTNCGTNLSVGGDAAIALRGDSTTVRNNTISGTPRYPMQIWPDCGSSGIEVTCPTRGKGNIIRTNTMTNIPGSYAGIQVRATANAATNKVYCDNSVPSGHAIVVGISCTP